MQIRIDSKDRNRGPRADGDLLHSAGVRFIAGPAYGCEAQRSGLVGRGCVLFRVVCVLELLTRRCLRGGIVERERIFDTIALSFKGASAMDDYGKMDGCEDSGCESAEGRGAAQGVFAENVVPRSWLEARREFTELNGGHDEGRMTDLEMLRLCMVNDNLEQLIKQGDASPENVEEFQRNDALISAYYRMLIPDDDRRAEVLRRVEAESEAGELSEGISGILAELGIEGPVDDGPGKLLRFPERN